MKGALPERAGPNRFEGTQSGAVLDSGLFFCSVFKVRKVRHSGILLGARDYHIRLAIIPSYKDSSFAIQLGSQAMQLPCITNFVLNSL